MILRVIATVLIVFVCSIAAWPQSSASPTQEKSHVERFSAPEVRAEKAEIDASAKLATNPNDDVALNSRALARIRLGKTTEAYEDLLKATALKPENSDYKANLGTCSGS
jgi:Flp pilus assembly protein TadD